MNVTESDRITHGIEFLRSNVYTNKDFKENFSQQLKDRLKASDVSFVANKYGGWSVKVTTDESDNNIQSDSYVNTAKESLIEAVKPISNEINNYSDLAHNLLNIIVSGPNSIVITI